MGGGIVLSNTSDCPLCLLFPALGHVCRKEREGGEVYKKARHTCSHGHQLWVPASPWRSLLSLFYLLNKTCLLCFSWCFSGAKSSRGNKDQILISKTHITAIVASPHAMILPVTVSFSGFSQSKMTNEGHPSTVTTVRLVGGF